MKIYDLKTDSSRETEYLKITDLDNVFNIVVDKRNNFIYNLNSTLYLSIDKSNLLLHQLDHDAYWTTISYKIYGSTRLAWLLMKLNNVGVKETLNIKHAGDVVYYIKSEFMNRIITDINGYEE